MQCAASLFGIVSLRSIRIGLLSVLVRWYNQSKFIENCKLGKVQTKKPYGYKSFATKARRYFRKRN